MSECAACKQKTPCHETCDLCLKNLYCSEECKHIGWSAHQEFCNVHTVDSPDTTLFVPYIEGELEEKDTIFDQNHIVRYVNPKGFVEQHEVIGADTTTIFKAGSMKPGRKLPNSSTIGVVKYSINIIYQNYTYSTEYLPVMNEKYMSSRENNNESGYVLTPGYEKTNGIKNNYDTTTGLDVITKVGYLQCYVTLTKPEVDDKALTSINGVYMFQDWKQSVIGDWKRKLTGVVMSKEKFQKKFGKTSLQQNDIESIIATRGPYAILLTFKVDRVKGKIDENTTARLIDIEFLIPTKDLDDFISMQPSEITKLKKTLSEVGTQLPFQCDATNLAHVTGLVMALEDKIEGGALTGPVIENQYQIISTYRQELENALNNGKTLEVSPKINASIKGATDALWEEIGRASFKKKIKKAYKNIKKNAQTFQENLETDKIAKAKDSLQKLINRGNGFVISAQREQTKVETAKDGSTILHDGGQFISRAEHVLEVIQSPKLTPQLEKATDKTRDEIDKLRNDIDNLNLKEDEITQSKKEIRKTK